MRPHACVLLMMTILVMEVFVLRCGNVNVKAINLQGVTTLY